MAGPFGVPLFLGVLVLGLVSSVSVRLGCVRMLRVAVWSMLRLLARLLRVNRLVSRASEPYRWRVLVVLAWVMISVALLLRRCMWMNCLVRVPVVWWVVRVMLVCMTSLVSPCPSWFYGKWFRVGLAVG